MSSESSAAEPAEANSGRWIGRRSFRWGLGGLALVGFTIGALPSLLSIPRVYRPLLSRVALGEFRLAIDSLDLSWWSPIRVHGLSVLASDPSGDSSPVIRVERIAGQHGLLRSWWSRHALGILEFHDVALDVSLPEEGGSLAPLLRRLAETTEESKPRAPSGTPFHYELKATDVRAIVRRQGTPEPLVVIPDFDLELDIRSQADETSLRIGPTRLLDQVRLTPELVHLGLDHVVPVLAQAAWLDGAVSVDLGEIRVPLALPLESTGTMDITFHEVRAGMANPAIRDGLDRLASLLGREAIHEVVLIDGNVAQVEIAEGVVRHRNIRLGLPRLDPRLQILSEGEVRLADRSLDLELSIPIPIELLARRDSVRELGVPMIRIPLEGDVENPHIRWDSLRGDTGTILGGIGTQLSEEAPVLSAAISALGGVTGGEADQAIRAGADALQAIRERLQQRRAESDDRDSPAGVTGEKSESPRQRGPILDRLRDRRRNSGRP